MRPVRKILGGATRLFLSPDGVLNLVPFAALADEHGKYLVETYSVTYLTSGRDLLRLQVSGESRQPPLVVADPLFDAKQAATAGGREGGRRSADMGRMHFGRLPGTAREAEALGRLLPDARVLTQAAATESGLKQVSSPRLLHVATHGFFMPDQTQNGGGGTRAAGLSGNGAARADARLENPLLRSGIALEGANGRSGVGGEDGILTALEAAALDLWGTKLVVLSACETGVGEVKNGEGVYGLRRALVLAGSESQVISLWQVSDEATRDLMVGYYKRLQAGEGRTEALRQVQLEMLRGGGQAGGSEQRGIGGKLNLKADRSHPYFWAAFIQSGDWRPIAGQAASPK
jgi:CHAT domain-containing protein